MACDEPKQEWTIATVTDPRPGKPSEESTLVFCVRIEDGKIEGQVSELKNGASKPSSTVTGTDNPVPGTNISFRTFNFRWGATNVMMAGNAFLNDPEVSTFDGRFAAFGAAEVAAKAAADSSNRSVTPQGPGDGDTGTGTGQQT